MTIGAILSGKGHEVISIDAGVSTREAVKLLAERRIGAVPVMDGAAVVGIFSERDLVYCLERVGPDALDKPVSELMTAPAITVAPGEGVLGALGLMTKRRIRHLPVVDGGTLVGFVSIGDLVKYRIDRIEAEANSLRDYIQQA
ncbi:CBS domain-containing protein [Sphingomonas japonica]|uniref:CBS domain-containing protein n=1 Tax=Sphingomonas japonica TaxID=511662 RepID=A0ABX0TXL7_9SPHN|nr:CBS domain-containing protein [Sphingomonas japonica]NIJ23054.1 CBS domain-containing protein [Sphingomonas japonica]